MERELALGYKQPVTLFSSPFVPRFRSIAVDASLVRAFASRSYRTSIRAATAVKEQFLLLFIHERFMELCRPLLASRIPAGIRFQKRYDEF